MKRLTGVLFVAACMAFPASARAETPVCDLSGASQQWQSSFGPSMGAALTAAHDVLGPQHVMAFAEHAREGWGVAFSPGALDETAARAAIQARLAQVLSPEHADALGAKLRLVPTPYSLAELAPVSAALDAATRAHDLFVLVSLNCHLSDAVRVVVSFNVAETPELRAAAEPLLAPYGDLVRLEFGGRWMVTPSIGTPPPPPAPPVTTPKPEAVKPARVRDHATVPSRCVRTRTLRVKPGAQVERLRLAAGKRTTSARNGRVAKLKLTARRTRVKVSVTLADGRTAEQTFTIRRCA